MRVADYVMQRIAEEGVGHIFMVAGGGAMHLVDALGMRDDVQYVAMLHEQAAAIAAEAYARVTNNLGVVLVTTGPGGTNALTGVAGAWLESTPCLVISGQVKRADLRGDSGLRQRGPQELDIVSIAKPITKYAVTVLDPEDIGMVLDEALQVAHADRPGPVWIDIPLDVQGATIDPGSLRRLPDPAPTRPFVEPASGPAHDVGEVAFEVIARLNAAERPVLLVGNGVRLAGAADDLLRLVDVLAIPVLTTWMGADLLWEEHPNYFGKPGTVASRGANFTVQNADLVLSIGARLDPAVIGFDQAEFARGAMKVVVDIDPAELAKLQFQHHLPICADAGEVIRALLERSGAIERRDRSGWLQRCDDWKRRYPVVLPEYWSDTGHVNTYVFSKVLSEELADDDLIIPGSSGVGIDTFWLAFEIRRGQRLYSTGGLGAMGFGVPASIGGCLASGRRRTISVDGDGGFQLNVQDLQTASRLDLPIKYFVLSNQGYASIRATQRNHFGGRLVGSDPSSGLTLPALDKIGSAFGMRTTKLSTNTDLRAGIREALAVDGPVVCEVLVAPDQPVGPRTSSVVRADGNIVSRPLEDLWPFLSRTELARNMLVPMLDISAEGGGSLS